MLHIFKRKPKQPFARIGSSYYNTQLIQTVYQDGKEVVIVFGANNYAKITVAKVEDIVEILQLESK